jgi:hypothetical protein
MQFITFSIKLCYGYGQHKNLSGFMGWTHEKLGVFVQTQDSTKIYFN